VIATTAVGVLTWQEAIGTRAREGQMAKKRAEGDKKPKLPSALADLLGQLERMKQDPTGSQVRLRADLARDSAEELFVKMRRQLRKQAVQIRQLQQRSDR